MQTLNCFGIKFERLADTYQLRNIIKLLQRRVLADPKAFMLAIGVVSCSRVKSAGSFVPLTLAALDTISVASSILFLLTSQRADSGINLIKKILEEFDNAVSNANS